MQDTQYDPSRELILDGNAVAGLLLEAFGEEMTLNAARCVHCGQTNMLGALLLFGGEMGSVLRCPGCEGVVMRIVVRRDALLLDMQGTSYMQLERVSQEGLPSAS